MKKIIKIIKKHNPYFIINFASQSMVGQSWNNSSDWYYTNSFGMIKLYENISNLDKNLKLIHISTPEVYGNIMNLTKENKIYNPTTPYAASRVTADQYLELLHNNKKINYCSVRASNVFGENQKLYRLIPKVIYSMLKKRKFKLEGEGSSKRNFIHIDDVSEATLKIMQKGKSGEIYHVSTDKILTIKKIVKMICKLMNYDYNKLVVKSLRRIGQDKFYVLSNSKLKKNLNWKQKVSLEDGLRRCINWVYLNLSSFKKNDENYHHKK